MVQIKTRKVTLPTPPADSENPGTARDTIGELNPVAEEMTTQVPGTQPRAPIPHAPGAYVYPSVETQANSPSGFYAPNGRRVRFTGRLAF